MAGDLDQDGEPELVVGARRPTAELYWLDRSSDGTWRRHDLDQGFDTIEAGGVLLDLDGDGDLDLVGGQDSRGDRLFWWECPDDPTQRWTRREICRMAGKKSHDQLAADLDGDGRTELYFWNQGAGLLCAVAIPDDPRASPWPGVRTIATDVREEGLAVADVDGDGRPELLAGFSWYRPPRAPGGAWERHRFADPALGLVTPRVVAADFDGDGRVAIAIAEGDASLSKRARGELYGQLVLFRRRGDPEAFWEPEVLHERLLDPHTLVVADFDSDGRPDLLCGEMGLPRGDHPHPPALRLYLSRGGRLEEHVLDRGIGVHDARVIELDGRRCIVSKSFRVLASLGPREPEADAIHLWVPD